MADWISGGEWGWSRDECVKRGEVEKIDE